MHFNPELSARDLPTLVSRFVSIVGWRRWQKRIEGLEAECRKSPIFEQFVKEKHATELELGKLLRRQRRTGRLPKKVQTQEFMRLFGLMAMVASVHSRLENQGKQRLRGMLVDALKRNFSSLEHEMGIAAHLMHRGFDVEFADLEGNARFEYVARREASEIELECKTVSYDLGRKIHRGDFHKLADRLWPDFKQYVKEIRKSRLVILTLADRLEPSDDSLEHIRRTVSSALWNDQWGTKEEGISVDVDVYEPTALPPDLESLSAKIEVQVGTHQFHLFVGGDAHAALIFVARSLMPDRVLAYMYRQLRRASDQFSGNRPAVLCVNIEDIYPHQWGELREGSGLQAMTSRYLSSRRQSHVHTVAYNSIGIVHQSAGRSSIVAPSLHYRNPGHARCDDSSLSIFD